MASLYLDHGIAHEVIAHLHAADHEAVTARSLGLAMAGDDEHLLTATRLGRILVTYDQDFITIHNAWRRPSAAWGISPQHAGVLITPQPPVTSASQGARALNTILASGQPLANELHRWTISRGWVHHPNP